MLQPARQCSSGYLRDRGSGDELFALAEVGATQ